jgi:2-polyprenyl-6-methoxyphenol hydroxylase-like FAD-dependent oxidoreductase
MAALIDQAVVIGAGIGGLFAAAALAPHAERVLVLDRDEITDEPAARDGTPQSRHPHVLLFGGMDAMCEWFPGFVDDVIAAGAIPAVMGRDIVAYRPEGRSYAVNAYIPDPADLGTTYVQTRPVLEACVRRRVLSLPNVELRIRTRVEALVHDERRVTGVRTANGETLASDLVIDASGRQSHLPQWLETMGFPRPVRSAIHCDMTYATTVVRPADWNAVPEAAVAFGNWNQGECPSRGGGMFKLAGGLWMIVLGGRYGDYPTTDWDEWCEFGRSIRYGPFADLIAGAIPVEPLVRYRLPTAIRWRYEQLDRFPDGIVPIGDAVAFFNPIYGQGMSAAAGECRALEAALRRRVNAGESIEGVALEYFPRMADWVRTAWALAAVVDFEDAHCTGDFPVEDVPDVERLAALAASPEMPDRLLSLDIGTLRKPLGALHDREVAAPVT